MAEAPLEICKLIERFKEHREEYLSGAYKEEQVCAEFILPMFEALGWDISNKQGSSEEGAGMKNSLAVFEDFKIRRLYDEKTETWFFSVVDIIQALIQQPDYQNERKTDVANPETLLRRIKSAIGTGRKNWSASSKIPKEIE